MSLKFQCHHRRKGKENREKKKALSPFFIPKSDSLSQFSKIQGQDPPNPNPNPV